MSSSIRCFAVLAAGMLFTALAHGQALVSSASRLARIKDITSVEGIRDNQLIGYGLVVGLRNTGDSQQTGFPVQTLTSVLARMGVNIPNAIGGTSSIRTQNMAAVFVTATLPAFAQPGNKIDVTISSAGDARSLEGGLLLLTPLYGADGKVYAAAQGPLVLGGYSVSANGNSQRVNHPTTGRIPDGAITEKAVSLELARLNPITFLLTEADFKSAESVAGAINHDLGSERARALDSRRIELAVHQGEDVPELLARLEMLPVSISTRARVVVNERTGTVVIGGDVRLSPVSILHGGLAIHVTTQMAIAPNFYGPATVVPETTVTSQDKPVNQIQLKEGSTVDDLVRGLEGIGATARDVISILQAMKQAGALEADLEVI
ncbi:MAG TPA: flagellar basal body P-ring protein FlgI [Acidobacteriaceae bacterium]